MPEQFDLIVLGGGRASGLAIAAAKPGWKTALIERDKLGGSCPNRGCVPSKLLIGFAEAARQVRQANRHFIDAEFKRIDLKQAFESVNTSIDSVDPRYEARVQASGATLIRGEGRFSSHKTITVNDRELTSDAIVIATGSRPVRPPYEQLPIWTSDDLFPLQSDPPASLMIIGGGVIACEMAAFFSGVGTKTRLFARGNGLLNREDRDIENIFQEEFGREVETHYEATLTDLQYDGRLFTASYSISGSVKTFTAERVLFAIGRRPNTEALELAKTGLTPCTQGFLPVNEYLQTEIPGIFAVGDVNGRFMLQHAASYEVYYLRQRFLKGLDEPIDERLVAHAVYSHPEVASIGLTEEQAKARAIPYVAILEDWLASARAMAMRIDYPRVKLIVSPEDYSILGCHLIGPESSTLLHQVLAVMKLKNNVRELATMIYVHPALNECLLAASVKAVSAVNQRRQKRPENNPHPALPSTSSHY